MISTPGAGEKISKSAETAQQAKERVRKIIDAEGIKFGNYVSIIFRKNIEGRRQKSVAGTYHGESETGLKIYDGNNFEFSSIETIIKGDALVRDPDRVERY
ncbi:MAG: hypothetical protein Q7R74_01215 [bacterium]|nr:hypothetical protein [bacterium]